MVVGARTWRRSLDRGAGVREQRRAGLCPSCWCSVRRVAAAPAAGGRVKIAVTIALKGAPPLTQVLEISERVRGADADYRANAREMRGRIERRVGALQRRYPGADVSWREVENG